MNAADVDTVHALVEREYPYGFSTDLDADVIPKGLDEHMVRLIAAKNDEPDWLLEWRLAALRRFVTLAEPEWTYVHNEPIDYQDISSWAAPKAGRSPRAWTTSTRPTTPDPSGAWFAPPWVEVVAGVPHHPADPPWTRR